MGDVYIQDDEDGYEVESALHVPRTPPAPSPWYLDIFDEAERVFGQGPWDELTKASVLSWLMQPERVHSWDPEQDHAAMLVVVKLGPVFGRLVMLSKYVADLEEEDYEFVFNLDVVHDHPDMVVEQVYHNGVVMPAAVPSMWADNATGFVNFRCQLFGFLFAD